MTPNYRDPKYTWTPYDLETRKRIIPTPAELGYGNFYDFQQHYFGEEHHYLNAEHQKEWGRIIDSDEEFVMVNEPRFSGKSITFSQELPIYYLLSDFNATVLLVSASDDLAKDYARAIVDHLKLNTRLREDYHTDWILDQKKGREGFSAHELHFKRTIARKETSFNCAGTGKSIIGLHPDIIILDDIIQTAKDRTGLRGEALQEWVDRVILNMEAKRYFVVGTRKAPDDIYNWFKEIGSFKISTRPAVGKINKLTGQRVPFIPEYETYFDDNKKKQIRITDPNYKTLEQKNAIIYWPEKYLLEKMLLKRERGRQSKEIFSGEYQNEPIPSHGLVFQREWIEWYDYHKFFTSEIFQKAGIYSFYDPAGASEWADWNVIITIAVYGSSIYIIDIQYGHWTTPEAAKKMRRVFFRWKDLHKFPMKMGVETSWWQTNIYLIVDKYNCGLLPLVERKPQEKKELRIDSLTTYFERHNVFVAEQCPGYEEFIKEYLMYDPEKARKKQIKVDVLDALQQAINLATFGRPAMLGVTYDT